MASAIEAETRMWLPLLIVDASIVAEARAPAPWKVVDQTPIFDQCRAFISHLLRGVVMATIAAPPPADRKASERKFYSRMALFLVFLVILGFGPSF